MTKEIIPPLESAVVRKTTYLLKRGDEILGEFDSNEMATVVKANYDDADSLTISSVVVDRPLVDYFD